MTFDRNAAIERAQRDRLKPHVLENLEGRAKSALADVGAQESTHTRLPARMLLSLISEVRELRGQAEPDDEDTRAVEITVTRSAGDDRAVLVILHTDFEPDGSDGGPGLRVLLNDDEAFVGKAYDFGAEHAAEEVAFHVPIPNYEGGLT